MNKTSLQEFPHTPIPGRHIQLFCQVLFVSYPDMQGTLWCRHPSLTYMFSIGGNLDAESEVGLMPMKATQ